MNSPQRTQPVFRSCLYVPGHHVKRIEQAYESEADSVILDLEDSVPTGQKALARDIVAQITAKPAAKPTYVRVNSMRSGLCEDDVLAVAGAGLAGIRLAKVGHPGEVRKVESLLNSVGSPATIHLLIETAYALETVFRLAVASPSVGMLGLGESDLRADLHTDREGPTMDASRARIIIASRAANLPSPCQSVFPEVRDLAGLTSTTEHGKRLGFVGRMAIHPCQIPIIHDVYTPTSEEIADAQDICEAAEAAQLKNLSVVITPKGKLVAPPIIANARSTLEMASELNVLMETS